MRKFLLMAAMPLTALFGATPAAAAGASLGFFLGATEGSGSIKKMFSAVEKVHVRGVGRIAPDGTLLLDQTVDEEGAAPRVRKWRVRETRPGHYVGTLSDASGPVVADAKGDAIDMHYPIKGGMKVSQHIVVAADGQSFADRMEVRKYGFVVARMEETTRRTGGR